MINNGDLSALEPPQSRVEALLLQLAEKIHGGGSLPIHICTSDEYNYITGVPTITSPSDSTLYLVPASSTTTGNLFDEWVYADSAWEKVGSANVNSPVQDVQVNGVSILDNGVANVPVASRDNYGAVKIGQGVVVQPNGLLYTDPASSTSIKLANNYYMTIPPIRQHESTFYGLAKAAGADEKDSTLPVGQYTDQAKSAIKSMLGISEGGGGSGASIDDSTTSADSTWSSQKINATKANKTPHNFAYDGRDLTTIFADADALYDAYSVENYDDIHVGDYWPVTLNGTYRDYGQLSVPVGTTYYSDTTLSTEAGVTEQIYTAEGVQNVNIPDCHEAYCTIKISNTTYYVAWDDCLPYVERTLSNAIMKFEVAAINHYWRYGDTGSDNFQNGRPHLVMSARDGLPHTLKMRKLNEVWERQHVDTFTGDGTTSEFTLSGTVGTIGYVFVAGTKKTYNTHYTYASNKITFKSGQIPANGAEIKIEWCEDTTPWTGSALYRTFNDPDYGILNLIQQADAKLYSHMYLGPNSKGMRYYGEVRSKTNQQGGVWGDRGILFLPTEDEVWGRLMYGTTTAHNVSQRQFALYYDGRRHASKGAGNAASRANVWTSSSTSVASFAYASLYGNPYGNGASSANAAAPCFLLT